MCLGEGTPIPEGAAGVRILKEGVPHTEQASPLTWAPASQGHSPDSAQCLADRPPHAGSGGTAARSSRRRCQVGRAAGTGSRSSPAHKTHSCLCLQSTTHSACSGHIWEEKFMGWSPGKWMERPPRPPGALESTQVPAKSFRQV